MLVSISLSMRGDATGMVPFSHHGASLCLATDDALAERRRIAQCLTPERLCELRRAPSRDRPDWTKMQLLYDAGLLCCPSGLRTFDTRNAPRSLWRFHWDLATALNSPSDENKAVAVASFAQLRREL